MLNNIYVLDSGSLKSLPIHYGICGKFLKRILMLLCCSKNNKINTCYSNVQKRLSYTKSYKIFYMCYRHCLEMDGN